METINPIPIRTYYFDWKNNLADEECEGIYHDLGMEYFFNSEKCANGIGTFKTLDTGNEAMHTMANHTFETAEDCRKSCTFSKISIFILCSSCPYGVKFYETLENIRNLQLKLE